MNAGRQEGLSRRDALRLGAAGIAGVCLSGVPLPGAEKKKKKIGIALQLYSVRADCRKDFAGTVEAVAKMGYEGVEFAGYGPFAKNPRGLRKLLDDNGLKSAGTHTRFNTLMGNRLKRTIEFHRIVGTKFLIVPGMRHKNAQGWLDAAKKLNEAAERVAPEGMFVGYHAHSHDFKKLGAKPPWEIFFDATEKEVIHQMDTGNCHHGGGDPLAMIRKYVGRTRSIHMKEVGGNKAVLGEGDMPWGEIIRLCRTVGGTDWFIAEQERYPVPPLQAVEKCIVNLKKLLGRK